MFTVWLASVPPSLLLDSHMYNRLEATVVNSREEYKYIRFIPSLIHSWNRARTVYRSKRVNTQTSTKTERDNKTDCLNWSSHLFTARSERKTKKLMNSDKRNNYFFISQSQSPYGRNKYVDVLAHQNVPK